MSKIKLIAILSLFVASPAFATPETHKQLKHTYHPFTYETQCALETKNDFVVDYCKVIETREKGGALRSRNIFFNKIGLTIKLRFDKEKGFVTWDSYNKYEYKWTYKIGGSSEDGSPWTYVMPGVLIQNVSLD